MIYGSYPVTPRSLPKRDDSIFQNAFMALFQVIADIFEETVVGDLWLKTSARNKGKGESRRKNTTGLVQGDVELLGKGEREEVLEVRVSSRGRVMRNTRKMSL